jgi:hypothetical protein
MKSLDASGEAAGLEELRTVLIRENVGRVRDGLVY